MNDTVQIDQNFVNGLADHGDTASESMGASVGMLSADAGAAADGLAGFATAAQLTATQAAWDRKAGACRDSLSGFAGSLRDTATTLPAQDGANATGVEQAGVIAE